MEILKFFFKFNVSRKFFCRIQILYTFFFNFSLNFGSNDVYGAKEAYKIVIFDDLHCKVCIVKENIARNVLQNADAEEVLEVIPD